MTKHVAKHCNLRQLFAMELILVLRVVCSVHVVPRFPIRFNEIELKGYKTEMLLNSKMK